MAQAAAEAAAAELAGAKQAAAEDTKSLQEEAAAKEQKLAEAIAIQEDLAVRLQVGQTWPGGLVKALLGCKKGPHGCIAESCVTLNPGESRPQRTTGRSLTPQTSVQESQGARHEAAADLQRSCEEVSYLQQQIFDLRQGVLETLQAEHAAMLAALGAVRRLCAELAPAASAQAADPAHLMGSSRAPGCRQCKPAQQCRLTRGARSQVSNGC